MKNEWTKNLNDGWNPVIFISLGNEWVLEVNKEKVVGFLHKIGNLKAGVSITAFAAYHDLEDRFEYEFVEEIKGVTINSDGFCEGIVVVRHKRGWIKTYGFLVNLKSGERRVVKI